MLSTIYFIVIVAFVLTIIISGINKYQKIFKSLETKQFLKIRRAELGFIFVDSENVDEIDIIYIIKDEKFVSCVSSVIFGKEFFYKLNPLQWFFYPKFKKFFKELQEKQEN